MIFDTCTRMLCWRFRPPSRSSLARHTCPLEKSHQHALRHTMEADDGHIRTTLLSLDFLTNDV